MIVFSRPPGRRRRAGDFWTSTLRSGSVCPSPAFAEAKHRLRAGRYNSGRRAAAAEDGSSSGGDALRRPREATLRTALRALTLSSRGPCDASSITAEHAPGLKNPQGRQMCHPPMKVSTGGGISMGADR